MAQWTVRGDHNSGGTVDSVTDLDQQKKFKIATMEDTENKQRWPKLPIFEKIALV